jgi:hypothetical protein
MQIRRRALKRENVTRKALRQRKPPLLRCVSAGTVPFEPVLRPQSSPRHPRPLVKASERARRNALQQIRILASNLTPPMFSAISELYDFLAQCLQPKPKLLPEFRTDYTTLPPSGHPPYAETRRQQESVPKKCQPLVMLKHLRPRTLSRMTAMINANIIFCIS